MGRADSHRPAPAVGDKPMSALPTIALPTNSVEVGGQPVKFRSLSRKEAMHLTQDFRDNPDAAEVFILAAGVGVTEAEAEEWRNSTDPIEAGKVIDGILILSGLADGQDPKGPTPGL